jgi:hypothetical protein
VQGQWSYECQRSEWRGEERMERRGERRGEERRRGKRNRGVLSMIKKEYGHVMYMA